MKSTISVLLFAWLALGAGATPAQTLFTGYQKAITYDDIGSDRRIRMFTESDPKIGGYGDLYSCDYDGTSWTWTNHGRPPGSVWVANSQPITYLDETDKRRIYVFAVDHNGELVVRYHKGAGFSWQWAKLGGPQLSGATISATTFVDDDGVRRIYVFASGPNPGGPAPYRLVTHYWNGSSWNWAILPVTPGTPLNQPSHTTVTHYKDASDHRRVDVFSKAGPNNTLVRHSLVQNAWSVTNLGGQVFPPMATVNYQDFSGNRHVHTVTRNPPGNDFWDRRGANAALLAHPAVVGDAPIQGISLINYNDEDGNLRMDLFASYMDGTYFRRAALNDVWLPWVQVALPPGNPQGVHNPNAITFLDSRGGEQHRYVFMMGPAYKIYAHHWNGSTWQWIDLGWP
jgi:hypothetical protein